MNRRCLGLIAIACTLLMLFGLASCNSRSLKDDYENGLEIPSELLEIEVYYGIAQFPAPHAPMSYTISINSDSVLTLEYSDIERYDNYSNITKQLSKKDILGLIDTVERNNFFKLAENLDGRGNVTDQTSRYLEITYNGKTNMCSSYNTRNDKFLTVCEHIERLSGI